MTWAIGYFLMAAIVCAITRRLIELWAEKDGIPDTGLEVAMSIFAGLLWPLALLFGAVWFASNYVYHKLFKTKVSP
jgi:hypothetical protein